MGFVLLPCEFKYMNQWFLVVACAIRKSALIQPTWIKSLLSTVITLYLKESQGLIL